MSRERLRGTAISTVVMLVFSALLTGAAVLRDPEQLLWSIPVSAAAAYYLWPRLTVWLIAQYRAQGWTLAPSWLRIAQSILLGLGAALTGVLINRVFDRNVTWTDFARSWVMMVAFVYLVWTPGAAIRSMGRFRRPAARG